MALSQLEEDMVGTLRRGLAIVTFCTCSFLIGAIVWFKKYRFPSSRLVLWLSVASAAQCIVYVMPYPKNDEILCDVQAFFISFFDWVIALWICIIAFNLHQSVVLKRRSSVENEKWYHTVAWGLSFIVALLPFAGGRSVYGPSGAWCWIVKDQQAWRTGTWYIPLLVFFIYVITMYIWIVKTLFNEKTQSFYHREAEDEIRNKWKMSTKLSRYPLIFVVLWILPIINRVENWYEDDDGIFVLVVLHTVCVSLQGTVNSIVYCFDEDILKQCTPGGLKATIVTYTSPDKRKTLELQKYQLQHDEEDDTVVRSIDLDPIPQNDSTITATTSEQIEHNPNNGILQSSIDTLVVNVPLQEE